MPLPRVFVAGAIAVALAAVSRTSASAQADTFQVECALPFAAIADHHSIDSTCPKEGQPKPANGKVPENEEQNRTKNNFCVGDSSCVWRRWLQTQHAQQLRCRQRYRLDTLEWVRPIAVARRA
jgi:hypothetical protein